MVVVLSIPCVSVKQKTNVFEYNPQMIIFQIVFLFILGVAVGMVVNYLSDVLPWRRRLVKPFCLNCQTALRYQNYFIYPRRCPECGQSRASRTWIVDLLFGIITVSLWFYHPLKLGFWGGLLVIGYFGVVTIIDLEHRLILHPVSIFGAGLGLVVGIYLHGFRVTILGGMVGFASMLVLYLLGDLMIRLMARVRGEVIDDVALGFGDVSLSGVLGLMLGFPGIVLGLFLARLLGGVVSLVYLVSMLVLRKYQMFSALPYGPFLIAGAILLLFFRDVLARLV